MENKNENIDSDKYGFKELSLTELIELYKDDDFIPYAQYLRTHSWKSKRLEILDRDNFRCKNCGGYETKPIKIKVETPFGTAIGNSYSYDWDDLSCILWTDLSGNERFSELTKPQNKPDKPYNLQIHHKKYILNRLPWEYNNEDLITLCNYCHLETHQNEVIPIYNETENLILDYNNCDRCGGTGYFPEYKHIANGVCFKCGGARFSIQIINKNVDQNKTNSNEDWKIVDDNIEFFRTLYSIHYPFSLKIFQSIHSNIVKGHDSNSCFEVEDVFVRDCRSNWGFYFNQKIEWTFELLNYWKEDYHYSIVEEGKFPLSQKKELEFYFKFNQEKFYAYSQASNMYFVDFENFIDSDGYLDKKKYDEVCKETELLCQKELSIAELEDAKFKVDFYKFDQSNYDLDYFFETFKSGNDFEIIKFIFNNDFFVRINNLVTKQIPNFSIESLFICK